MGAVHYAALLAITLVHLQFYSSTAQFNIPFVTPSFGNACQEENVCGKGKCVVSNSSNFGFACECETGWSQTRARDDDNFMFLPCIIPNCSLNSNCANAPPPSADNNRRANMSFFDPCYWTDCGGGRCNNTSLFTLSCECEEGYYNLFNTTTFPCYRECAFGMGCSDLGLTFPNTTSSRRPNSNPGSANDSNNQSRLIPGVERAWLISMLTILALVMRKNT